jgi:hypothetical protein
VKETNGFQALAPAQFGSRHCGGDGHRDTQVDEDSAARAAQVSADATETISAIDDALLDDAEAAMTSTLFEPGEVITRAEPEEVGRYASGIP